jgi:hypothetical protein
VGAGAGAALGAGGAVGAGAALDGGDGAGGAAGGAVELGGGATGAAAEPEPTGADSTGNCAVGGVCAPAVLVLAKANVSPSALRDDGVMGYCIFADPRARVGSPGV